MHCKVGSVQVVMLQFSSAAMHQTIVDPSPERHQPIACSFLLFLLFLVLL
jgi:hypothetical protein